MSVAVPPPGSRLGDSSNDDGNLYGLSQSCYAMFGSFASLFYQTPTPTEQMNWSNEKGFLVGFERWFGLLRWVSLCGVVGFAGRSRFGFGFKLW